MKKKTKRFPDYEIADNNPKKQHEMNEMRFCKNCGMIAEDLGFDEGCKGKKKIKCNNCERETGMYPSDFPKGYDLTDIYCSEECRYNFETGHSGEEY